MSKLCLSRTHLRQVLRAHPEGVLVEVPVVHGQQLPLWVELLVATDVGVPVVCHAAGSAIRPCCGVTQRGHVHGLVRVRHVAVGEGRSVEHVLLGREHLQGVATAGQEGSTWVRRAYRLVMRE